MSRRIYQIEERLPILDTIPLSLQHVMAMFGANVLVPLLFGINPAITLLMNGIGTLLYSYVTKGGIPSYLGSSFAFIAPTLLIISKTGYNHAQSGFIVAGLLFVIAGIIVKKLGTRWIDIVLPPPVMGAVVAVIGLELAPVAADMAGLTAEQPDAKVLAVSLFTFLVGVIGSLVFRGFFQVIPVLIAVVSGYLLALVLGMVNFDPVTAAPWLKLPEFHAPVMDLHAILLIMPASLVVLAEHIGHLIVTGNIVERDLMKKPGLHLSLIGDGISNMLSGLVGSPPNTTYGENIGVMAITRVYSVWVIRGAAVIAILASTIGKLSALIQSIPVPVMGGVSLLLFGVIATAGIRMLVERRLDYSRNYNMVLSAIVLITGVSGAKVTVGTVELKGMVLSAVIGVVISLTAYVLNRFSLLNDPIPESFQPTQK
ncbi:MAG: uracil permease [Hydrogenibacillus sp.]|nr:uracil permease [Hydrogenibacillus sp.]